MGNGAAAKLGLTAETIRNRYPLGRVGTSEEVATTIASLASDEASFLTGAIVAVDGGTPPDPTCGRRACTHSNPGRMLDTKFSPRRPSHRLDAWRTTSPQAAERSRLYVLSGSPTKPSALP